MVELAGIRNWRRRDAKTTLSGQPTEAQMGDLAALGVTQLINLAPHSNKGAHENEPASAASYGMIYTYIPVDFDRPTEKDFAKFQAALAKTDGTQRHIHCIYNARVTAFFYRHDPTRAAFDMMDGIWRPGGIWAKVIGKPSDADKPHRYKGYDY